MADEEGDEIVLDYTAGDTAAEPAAEAEEGPVEEQQTAVATDTPMEDAGVAVGPVQAAEEGQGAGEDAVEPGPETEVNAEAAPMTEDKPPASAPPAANPNTEASTEPDFMSLPPHGTELFISRLPRTATEAQVKAFCCSLGDEVFALRMPKEPGKTDTNKGFAFCVYKTREGADAALEKLNQAELPDHPGRKAIVVRSDVKNKLFLGGLPRDMSKEGLITLLEAGVKGIISVELGTDRETGQHRGFGFVEMYNHAAAEAARRYLGRPDFRIQGREITVTWAEPRRADKVQADTSVRSVYVGNLPDEATEDKLRTLFAPYGTISGISLPPDKENPKKLRGFGFVHFEERASALKAVAAAEAQLASLAAGGKGAKAAAALTTQAEDTAMAVEAQAPAAKPAAADAAPGDASADREGTGAAAAAEDAAAAKDAIAAEDAVAAEQKDESGQQDAKAENAAATAEEAVAQAAESATEAKAEDNAAAAMDTVQGGEDEAAEANGTAPAAAEQAGEGANGTADANGKAAEGADEHDTPVAPVGAKAEATAPSQPLPFVINGKRLTVTLARPQASRDHDADPYASGSRSRHDYGPGGGYSGRVAGATQRMAAPTYSRGSPASTYSSRGSDTRPGGSSAAGPLRGRAPPPSSYGGGSSRTSSYLDDYYSPDRRYDPPRAAYRAGGGASDYERGGGGGYAPRSSSRSYDRRPDPYLDDVGGPPASPGGMGMGSFVGPGGVTMVPMMLPTGQMAYVMAPGAGVMLPGGASGGAGGPDRHRSSSASASRGSRDRG